MGTGKAKMRGWRAKGLGWTFAVLAFAPASASGQDAAPAGATAASIERQFRDPPPAVRPWLAWDWLAGQVSEPAISLALARAAQAGFAGVTLAQGSRPASAAWLETGSEPWRAALAHASREAARLGLDLALEAPLAGPWVPVADRAARLVWAETALDAADALPGLVPAPPLAGTGDVALLAFPDPAQTPLPPFLAYSGSGARIDAAPLVDADPASAVELPSGKGAGPPSLLEVFGAPVTVQAATLSLAAGQELPGLARLEASDDAVLWRPLAELPLDSQPVTVAFAPATAQYFRAVFPVPGSSRAGRALRVGTMRLHAESRVHRFEALSGLDPAPPTLAPSPVAPTGIDPGSVLDLTARLRADGSIDWTPPPGRWRLLRIGRASVGQSGDAVDRLDGVAVRRALLHMLGDPPGIRSLAVPPPAPGNWTPRLGGEFRRLRGYDLLPWMPVLTGVVVGSQGQSEAFLSDYRRTLADLEASGFRATHAQVARQAGLRLPPAASPEGDSGGGGSFQAAARAADLALLAGRERAVAMDPAAPGAELARTLADYLARTRLMLSRSRAVADVLVLAEDDASAPSDAPTGYGYATIAGKALDGGWTVAGGDLAGPDGASHKVLWLGRGQRRLTLELLRRLTSLAEAGATIVGLEPAMDAGMADDEVEFIALAARLWPGEPRATVGRGRVIASDDIDAALAGLGLAPGFHISGGREGADIAFLHRRFSDGESWFLVNRGERAERFDGHFRIAGKAAELWRPDSGAREPASYRIEGGETVVPLMLAAGETVHVVFRQPASVLAAAVERPEPGPIATLDDAWTVTFQKERGAPRHVVLPALVPLGLHPDKAIRAFAGMASYAKVFGAPADWRAGTPLWLDPGPLARAAEVVVNGQPAGIAWRAPWRVEIGALAKPGLNQLELRVVVDAGDPGASGLVGPVTLLAPR